MDINIANNISRRSQTSGDERASGVIVFDIGGTWFRSGVYTADGALSAVTRRPALNYLSYPELEPEELQQALVDYLIDEVRRLQTTVVTGPGQLPVSISLGAALNAHSGFVLNSGPLWGPRCRPFDLPGALRMRAPAYQWTVVNDITAALLRYVSSPRYADRARLTLLTISTGIGLRTYDSRTRTIPIERRHGVQGEIGHLPIRFLFQDRLLEQRCDCGGHNHLNAFCSGRGIERLLRLLPALDPNAYRCSSLARLAEGADPDLTVQQLGMAAREHDRLAMTLLDAITRPVSDMLLALLTVDPEVEGIILTGGVVHALGDPYYAALLRHLETTGLYQISLNEADYFQKRLLIGEDDDNSGLIGAGVAVAH